MLVKIFLVFIGFLLFGWISAQTPPEQRKLAKILNQDRKEAARKLYIPNMHELVYDKNLADVAGTKDWSIENKKNRFMSLEEIKNAHKNFENMSGIDLRKLITNNGVTRDWEYLNPLQTKIGCAITAKNLKMVNQPICTFGDQNDLNVFNKTDGAPGSKCMPGYENDDGLCSVDKVLAQKSLIAELNQLRRSYAIQYEIIDMHELIIQDELVEMAEKFIGNGTLPSPGVDWRYTWFFDYQNGAIFVEEANQDFMNLPTENFTIQWTKQQKTFVRTFEHLNPLQKHIGCAEKESGFRAFSVMCFLGPSNTYKEFLRGVPGSKCSQGYVNTNGLCTLVPIPKKIPETQTSSSLPQTTSPPFQPDPSAAPKNSQNTIHIPYNSQTSLVPLAPPTESSTSGNPDSLVNVFTKQDFKIETTTTTSISPLKSVDNAKVPHSKNQKSPEQQMTSKPTPAQPSKTDLLIAEYLKNEKDGDVPDEDDYHMDVDSLSNNIVWMITVVFVVIRFL